MGTWAAYLDAQDVRVCERGHHRQFHRLPHAVGMVFALWNDLDRHLQALPESLVHAAKTAASNQALCADCVQLFVPVERAAAARGLLLLLRL